MISNHVYIANTIKGGRLLFGGSYSYIMHGLPTAVLQCHMYMQSFNLYFRSSASHYSYMYIKLTVNTVKNDGLNLTQFGLATSVAP